MSRGRRRVEVSIVALDTRVTLGGEARAAYLELDKGEETRFKLYLEETIREALKLPGDLRQKLSDFDKPVAVQTH